MSLEEALKETGIAEAQVHSQVYTVKNDQTDYSPTEPDGDPVWPFEFTLSIQDGAMPPHTTQGYNNLGEIEEAHPDLDWESVEMEG